MNNLRLGLAMLVAAAALSAGADESATEISRKSRERGGINLLDLTAEMKLATVDRDGQRREQSLVTTARKVAGKERSMTRFTAPAGVAGVTVLTVEGSLGAGDDISLYLPKLKRVRKVARTQRGESFMDTDFTYADLGATGGLQDGAVARQGDEVVDGRGVYVLKGPASDDSPYGTVVAYVDKETFVPLRVEYSDKDGKPFKRYRSLKLKKFRDRVLSAEAVMENLKTGSKTQLDILRLEDSKLGDEDFTERALERG